MKRTKITIVFLTCLLLFIPSVFADRTSPLIIDHTCTDLSQIPVNWIEQAKSNIKLHYAHTSHGGQLTGGLESIMRQDSTYSYDRDVDGLPSTAGSLCILDGMRPYADDVYISPTDYFSNDWNVPYHAHGLLNSEEYKGVINVSAFSWCRQMSDGNTSYDTIVEDYLQAMARLEQDNPEVTFVYFTGNAQCGPGNHDCSSLSDGYRRYMRNEQIRAFCRTNNKVLFDFADIDSWWFNTETSQWEYATYEHTVGDQTFNVPYEHPQYNSGGCGHTSYENCENKGKAVWHLMSRLAGWGDCIAPPTDLIAQSDSENQQIVLSWTHNSDGTNADTFIIHRRVGDGTWVNNHGSVAGDTTTFTDSDLAVGSYQYRIVAHLNDDGNGEPCDSAYSNEIEAQIEDPNLPEAPDGLTAQANVDNGTISLTWTNNADDATGFIIHRQVTGADWVENYGETDADTTQYIDTNNGDGPLASGTYTYRVVAVNTHGPSAFSNEASAEIPTDATDSDEDGVPDDQDGCPNDPNKTESGACGCGTPDVDGDEDGTPDCTDQCLEDPDKTSPGQCGCGEADTDSDNDDTADCNDLCAEDPDKTEPGTCGCGEPETDADDDNTPDCNDQCPEDPDKTGPGQCGCGVPETDPCNLRPRTPELSTPADASTDISRSPVLNSGDFQDPDNGDTHAQTIWQIATNTEFDEPVYNETSEGQLTAFTVPEPLEAETTYFWRVCYIDNRGAQSEWPESFSFTTGTEVITPDSTPDDGGGSDGNGSSGCFVGAAGR